MDFLPLIIRAEYRQGYRIRLTFNDGRQKTVDTNARAWLKRPPESLASAWGLDRTRTTLGESVSRALGPCYYGHLLAPSFELGLPLFDAPTIFFPPAELEYIGVVPSDWRRLLSRIVRQVPPLLLGKQYAPCAPQAVVFGVMPECQPATGHERTG